MWETLAASGLASVLGYAVGKGVKLLLAVLGIVLLLALLLEQGGFITVNWGRVAEGLQALARTAEEAVRSQSPDALKELALRLGLPLGGFAIGFYLGLKH